MKSKTKTKRKKIETALLFWLNSGNENATQGAYLIERALKNKCAHPSFDSPKNWTGDYKHENDNYICRCIDCKEYFYGYKRRVFCFECAGNLD